MLEVEVKYRVADHAAVIAKLSALGAEKVEERADADHYFNAPDRDFKQTDEAFRLRRIGAKNYLTYKGPKRDTATKTRPEIEVALADGDETAADTEKMLVGLRYRPVAVVHKRRTVYRLIRGGFNVEVCLDDVARVGQFVELEVIADETQYEGAKAVILQLAAELDLTEQERRSYLGMTLATQS